MRNAIFVALAILFCLPSSRAQDCPAPFALTHRDDPLLALNPQPAPKFSLTVPRASEFSIQILSGIHSRISRVGDPIQAQVMRSVYVNGRVALPSGSLLDGRITRVRSAGHAHQPGELAFRFERITLPDGQAEPIAATLRAVESAPSQELLLDSEGYFRGGRFVSSRDRVAGLVGLGSLVIPRVPLVASAGLHALLPMGGAALLGFEIFWARGNDVHVPPHTRCRIRLVYPLTVRAAG